MGMILSGKEPAAAILEEVKTRMAKLRKTPKLVIIQVGSDPASNVYVRKKLAMAEETGITAETRKLPASATERELLALVEELNNDASVDGFIAQMPLPLHMADPDGIIERIKPEKDVDGFTSSNIGKLRKGLPKKTFLAPATPSGIIKMLEHYGIGVGGKHAVVVGRSVIVGKPIADMLLNRNATVTVCHSKTENLAEHTAKADILVVAVGKPGLITADMVREGAAVIDVGTTNVNGKIKGDVEFDGVLKKAHCSPVPGGVGPMTVAMLLYNVIKAAERGADERT